MPSRLAIIDYGTGNLRSVLNAITHVGGKAELVAEPENLGAFSHLLLPGVGSFRRAMEQIQSRGFDQALVERVGAGIPILGICLGMQLLGRRSSEDGETQGLGLVDCEVDRFAFDRAAHPALKIPHVGFDTVEPRAGSHLFAGLGKRVDFYFTHSYRMQCLGEGAVAARCWHGEPFVAAIEQGHIAATQFHPEKSQANGLRLLRNFLELF